MTRREFGALVATGVVGYGFAGPLAFGRDRRGAITAGEIIERIRRGVGESWSAETIDGVKAGDLGTVVTGVATTALASLEVLRQAADSGANLIITSGTTFYGRADSRTPQAGRGMGAGPGGAAGRGGAPAQPPPPDPVLTAKNAFIDERGLVVFRFFDHWHRRSPDPFAQGLAEAMGWGAGRVPGELARYDVAPLTLRELASTVKARLGSRGGIRVIGDPAIQVRRVALLPGTTAITDMLQALPAADAVIAGEVREWESVEYARDVVHSGRAKGLILVGRIVSEEPGMRLCADWLGTLVPEVSVRHIPAGDPYWRPSA